VCRNVSLCVAGCCSALQCVVVCVAVWEGALSVPLQTPAQYISIVKAQRTATPCTTLQHPAPHCNTLQHTATHCITSALRISTVLVSATHCNTCNTLQHTATHCNALQPSSAVYKYCMAVCNTLQHSSTHCNTLQHTASPCNTLQPTATHCNTLQHTATPCNTL